MPASERDCAQCGEPFEAKRATALYCSGKCRKRAQRSRGPATEASSAPAPASDGDVAGAVREKLAAAKVEATPLGRSALVLARRIDTFGAIEPGAALASLTRELRATLEAALMKADAEGDPVDELARQRSRRREATRGA